MPEYAGNHQNEAQTSVKLKSPPTILPLSLFPCHSTMERIAIIPAELWREIIAGACTDGGYTGRSLALTNKLFHAQSLSARFHSLAFFSLAKLEAFLAFLDNQPRECKPKIQHMYLSFVDEPEPAKPRTNFWRTYAGWSLRRKLRYDETIKAQKLWYAILEAQTETGNPFMLYKDAANGAWTCPRISPSSADVQC